MAVFQLKLIRSRAKDDPIRWNYDRAELLADGSLGIKALALCIAANTQRYDVTVYTIVLLTMFGVSATYNLWPVSPWKWLIRRFDHAIIYLLISARAAIPRFLGAGAWQHGSMAGYTSVGAGTSILPVRLNCPAEITLHTLHSRRSSKGKSVSTYWDD